MLINNNKNSICDNNRNYNLYFECPGNRTGDFNNSNSCNYNCNSNFNDNCDDKCSDNCSDNCNETRDVSFSNKRFTIIGLGLIGGSLAKAFRQYLGTIDIASVDTNKESLRQALKDGTISHAFTGVNEHVLKSDVIFICTPVRTTIDYIKKLYGKTRPGCIVTDVGSTKGEIIDYINSLRDPPCFIGGHPMTGMEKCGYAASLPHLFENAYYILTPSKSSSKESLDFMSWLIRDIGGIPLVIDATTHDRATAGISHVPHIIASALVNLVREIDSPDGKMQMLAAGGFKDITRIASSDPEMWQDIVLSNKEQIEDILNLYTSMLHGILQYIRENRVAEIHGFFESAKNFRDSFAGGRKGPIAPLYQLTVDVVDRPG
ncbi:MAG: prephenate dehydrogenase, partial [Clostridiaceae bacterium]|nr:prephenate dehydrogenase [Clostridiaceae bacterium]